MSMRHTGAAGAAAAFDRTTCPQFKPFVERNFVGK
jgi:hypothetical protein